MTKEKLKLLKALKLKQYRNPSFITKEEEELIKTLERIKYTGISVLQSGNSVTPSPSHKTASSSGSGTSSVGSNKSNYSVLVQENRLWKHSYASRKLSDYDVEMENNLEHFMTAATFRAPFLLFIRLVYISFLVLFT